MGNSDSNSCGDGKKRHCTKSFGSAGGTHCYCSGERSTDIKSLDTSCLSPGTLAEQMTNMSGIAALFVSFLITRKLVRSGCSKEAEQSASSLCTAVSHKYDIDRCHNVLLSAQEKFDEGDDVYYDDFNVSAAAKQILSKKESIDEYTTTLCSKTDDKDGCKKQVKAMTSLYNKVSKELQD